MSELPAAAAFGRVAVLCGGHSSERQVSLHSGEAVWRGLKAYGIDAVRCDPVDDELITRLRACDRAFVVLHGRGGEDGQIQALLEQLAIPYTGSGLRACALAMDKLWCKAVWRDQGLPVLPDLRLCADDSYETVSTLLGSTTLVVKPALEGSSVGVSKVCCTADYAPAWQAAGGAQEKIMAEPWIDGRELTYAILGDTVLPGIEITASQSHSFYDYNAKYLDDKTRYVCPAPLDPALDASLCQTAMEAFRAVDARGWGRVDYLLDADNHPWLLEINTVPGMTDHSLVPLAARAAGIDFTTLVVRILAQTLLPNVGTEHRGAVKR